MTVLPLPTSFAPAERSEEEIIERQARMLTNHPLVRELLDYVPDLLLVLNCMRQVVFANQSVLSLALDENGAGLLGQRPGEILGCIHSQESESGCGTSDNCATCGAVLAILEAQMGKKEVRECRITVERREGREALDLKVCASGFQLNGERFVLLAISDLSDQKRRQALERIFFHDILNTAGSLRGLAYLLQDAKPEQIGELSAGILSAADHLVREIQDQKDLLAAETGDLAVNLQTLEVGQFLEQVAALYHGRPSEGGVRIRLQPPPESTFMISDPTLLGRVVGNLLKNAVEASEPGEEVTMGARILANGWVEFWVHNPAVMPRKTQLQVFKRSFTTKGPGRGLGTYSVMLLTQRYLHGEFEFTSNASEGTTFRVRYPRHLS